MSKPTNFLQSDISHREQNELDYVIKTKKEEQTEAVPRVSVAEARQGASQINIQSSRDSTRLLFISRDTTLLNQTTQSLDGYLELTDVFDEVHIVILQPGIRTLHPILRVAPNVWIYIASAKHWWWTPVVALQMIESQLRFADGFRPDLIVARDPYESALVAFAAASRYRRATQLHILEDFSNPKVKAALPHSWLRTLLAPFMVRRFQSVRTATDTLLQNIERRFPNVIDGATLPRFRNYRALRELNSNVTIKEKYHQFTFIITYVGSLVEGCLAYQAIDAARSLLRNPRVGLVIVGDGPIRAQLQKRAILLGVEKQVVFEKAMDTVALYLTTADVLLVPDTDSPSDDRVIAAAFAGVPVVSASTPMRSDIFTHGESAFLCAPNDTLLMAKYLNILLNDIELRQRFAVAARASVVNRLHEDPEVYKRAYRDSVEAALFVTERAADSVRVSNMDNTSSIL